MKLSLATLALMLCITSTQSQKRWEELMLDPNSTKKEISDAYYSKYKALETEYYQAMQAAAENGEDFFRTPAASKFKVITRFQRYNKRVLSHLRDEDKIKVYSEYFNTFQEYNMNTLKSQKTLRLKSAENSWVPIGPSGYVKRNNSVSGGGGRIDCLKFHPKNNNIMYACSPAGGLWKTTNGGADWVGLTDYTGVTATSDILIHPENPDTLYLATGESDTWWMNGSIGVLRSFDGGQNWETTGLKFSLSQHVRIQKLLMHPSNYNTLYAGTSVGLYRSTDGGNKWFQLNSLDIWDMDFKPNDPNTIFIASNGGFYKATLGGVLLKKITSGLPLSNIGKVNLAVSNEKPDRVYAIFQGINEANSFLGLYRSDDAGENFSLVYNEKNLFTWDENNLTDGTGGWEIAVSDVNANYIMVGGIHTWRSKNGGSTWERVGAHDDKLPVTKWTHCDVHFQTFLPGDSMTYFSCNDGGIYKTTNDGVSWSVIIGEMSTYFTDKLGISAINGSKFLSGTQDNSTVFYNGSKFSQVGSGDGQNCFFDRTNDNNLYLTAQNGWMQRSTNGGSTWKYIGINTGKAAWAVPFMQDPSNANTIYQARQQVFKSTNKGDSWAAISSLETTNSISSMDICAKDNSVIWIVENNTNKIYRFTNGGANYTTISNPTKTSISQIIAHPTDPLKAYVVCGTFSAGNKVFKTENGGASWINISGDLPNLPVNCIYYQRGSNDRLYIGMNIGLYYRDNTENKWILYSEGLPNSEITDIQYFYPTNTLKVAVYGRGVWEKATNFATGVNQIPSDEPTIRAYPNPVINTLHVESGNYVVTSIRILGLGGQKLHEKVVPANIETIDVEKLKPGVYILQAVLKSGGLYQTKFIKE